VLQRFWLSVLGALRQTAPGSVLVQPLTAAPDLDGRAIAERLLKDLAPLEDRVWLVIDDVHKLGGDQALRQLELLLMRAPNELRFVLVTRHDVRLGLHRLRLEGELAEIREPDLRFTLTEARELFDAARGADTRSGAVGGADRGLGGGAAAGGAGGGRAPGLGPVRGRVLRHRADGGRVPGCGGA
jgi:LuxR family transcriptional regulator, maltose regulon positive regulatory protein